MSESTTPQVGRPPAADPLVPIATALPREAVEAVRTLAARDCIAESGILRTLVLEALRARGLLA